MSGHTTLSLADAIERAADASDAVGLGYRFNVDDYAMDRIEDRAVETLDDLYAALDALGVSRELAARLGGLI